MKKYRIKNKYDRVRRDYIPMHHLKLDRETFYDDNEEIILYGDNIYKNEREELDRHLILIDLIESLTPEQEKFMKLILEGYSVCEAGKMLGLEATSTHSYYNNCIAKLRRRYFKL